MPHMLSGKCLPPHLCLKDFGICLVSRQKCLQFSPYVWRAVAIPLCSLGLLPVGLADRLCISVTRESIAIDVSCRGRSWGSGLFQLWGWGCHLFPQKLDVTSLLCVNKSISCPLACQHVIHFHEQVLNGSSLSVFSQTSLLMKGGQMQNVEPFSYVLFSEALLHHLAQAVEKCQPWITGILASTSMALLPSCQACGQGALIASSYSPGAVRLVLCVWVSYAAWVWLCCIVPEQWPFPEVK